MGLAATRGSYRMPKRRSALRESPEAAVLARAVARSLAQGCAGLRHLSTPLGRASYVRKAQTIAQSMETHCAGGRRILDWGCGYGQMSWLLRNAGFEVVAYTIEPQVPCAHNLFLREQNLALVHGEDPVRLPFKEAAFDAVLSCGVLEHVEDECGSLAEIARVLRPGGLFFVMMLPNAASWAEFLARRVFRASDHDRLYTMDAVRALLARFGFHALETWYANTLPRNLTPLPESLRRRLGAYPCAWLRAERWVSRVPGVARLSGVVEGVFRRT